MSATTGKKGPDKAPASPKMSNIYTPNVDNYVDAPNIIRNDTCKQCERSDVDFADMVNCLFCKNDFHAINCSNDQSCDVSPKTGFTNYIYPAISNTGSFEKRPGNFKFICDFCITSFEQSNHVNQSSKINILDDSL